MTSTLSESTLLVSNTCRSISPRRMVTSRAGYRSSSSSVTAMVMKLNFPLGEVCRNTIYVVSGEMSFRNLTLSRGTVVSQRDGSAGSTSSSGPLTPRARPWTKSAPPEVSGTETGLDTLAVGRGWLLQRLGPRFSHQIWSPREPSLDLVSSFVASSSWA